MFLVVSQYCLGSAKVNSDLALGAVFSLALGFHPSFTSGLSQFIII